MFSHPNSSAPALSLHTANPPTLTHRSQTAPTKRLAFAANLSVYDTFPATVYDRRSEPATWSRLTPALAQRIKEELNSYKMEEMEPPCLLPLNIPLHFTSLHFASSHYPTITHPPPSPLHHHPIPPFSFTYTYSCTTPGFLDQVSAVSDLIQVIVYPSILTCNTMTHVARSLQYADGMHAAPCVVSLPASARSPGSGSDLSLSHPPLVSLSSLVASLPIVRIAVYSTIDGPSGTTVFAAHTAPHARTHARTHTRSNSPRRPSLT
ncbi:hypothetical protein NUW54_g2273 [Trametes sanguinea]|uniref:Uncharacterized protein n=1 Tax=Trametes sanguinea TaxID=158606 RepID=A0ACC1Q752_9APHY|nr:hypothetical protein NUW54_g2273 [Trametes sanguinea]